jgi:hypothetical protein
MTKYITHAIRLLIGLVALSGTAHLLNANSDGVFMLGFVLGLVTLVYFAYEGRSLLRTISRDIESL